MGFRYGRHLTIVRSASWLICTCRIYFGYSMIDLIRSRSNSWYGHSNSRYGNTVIGCFCSRGILEISVVKKSHVTSNRSNSQQFQMAPRLLSVSNFSTIGGQLLRNLRPMRIGEYMYFSLVMETPLVYLILYQEMEEKIVDGNRLWQNENIWWSKQAWQ